MWAIRNIKTGKWVYGTDYRYHPFRQRTSRNKMLTYETEEDARFDFKHRCCGKSYRIVCLKTIEVKREIPLDYHGRRYRLDYEK